MRWPWPCPSPPPLGQVPAPCPSLSRRWAASACPCLRMAPLKTTPYHSSGKTTTRTRECPQQWQEWTAASLQDAPGEHQSARTFTWHQGECHSQPHHASLLRMRTRSLHISRWTSIRPFTATHLDCTLASVRTDHTVSPLCFTLMSPASSATHRSRCCPSPAPSEAATSLAHTTPQPVSCRLHHDTAPEELSFTTARVPSPQLQG